MNEDANEQEDYFKNEIESISNSIVFFGNNNKFNRERWVVQRLLDTLGIPPGVVLLEQGDEPCDVAFEDCRFQVKEILDDGRKRTRDYKAKLATLISMSDRPICDNADDVGSELEQAVSNLVDPYVPVELNFADLVTECFNYASSLITSKKYGARETRSIDLLIYFNKINCEIRPGLVPEITPLQFRSLSVVSNTYCSVIYAHQDAPVVLKAHAREVINNLNNDNSL